MLFPYLGKTAWSLSEATLAVSVYGLVTCACIAPVSSHSVWRDNAPSARRVQSIIAAERQLSCENAPKSFGSTERHRYVPPRPRSVQLDFRVVKACRSGVPSLFPKRDRFELRSDQQRDRQQGAQRPARGENGKMCGHGSDPFTNNGLQSTSVCRITA